MCLGGLKWIIKKPDISYPKLKCWFTCYFSTCAVERVLRILFFSSEKSCVDKVGPAPVLRTPGAVPSPSRPAHVSHKADLCPWALQNELVSSSKQCEVMGQMLKFGFFFLFCLFVWDPPWGPLRTFLFPVLGLPDMNQRFDPRAVSWPPAPHLDSAAAKSPQLLSLLREKMA